MSMLKAGLGQHGLWMSKGLPRDWDGGTDEAEEARLTMSARLHIWVEREKLPSITLMPGLF